MHFCLPRSRHTSFCPGRHLSFVSWHLSFSLFIRAIASCLFSSHSWVFVCLAKVPQSKNVVLVPLEACSALYPLFLRPRPSLSDNHTLCHRHSQMTRHSVLPSLPLRPSIAAHSPCGNIEKKISYVRLIIFPLISLYTLHVWRDSSTFSH